MPCVHVPIRIMFVSLRVLAFACAHVNHVCVFVCVFVGVMKRLLACGCVSAELMRMYLCMVADAQE